MKSRYEFPPITNTPVSEFVKQLQKLNEKRVFLIIVNLTFNEVPITFRNIIMGPIDPKKLKLPESFSISTRTSFGLKRIESPYEAHTYSYIWAKDYKRWKENLIAFAS